MKSHTDSQSAKIKDFLQTKLEINTNTNVFKYNGIDMIHSNEYANDTSMPGNLIHKYFAWIEKTSKILTENLLQQISVYFDNDYGLFHDSTCFDPLWCVPFFLYVCACVFLESTFCLCKQVVSALKKNKQKKT